MREVALTGVIVNGLCEGVGNAGGGSGGIGRSEGGGRLRYGHLCWIFRTQGGVERAYGGNRVESLWRGEGGRDHRGRAL